MKKKLRGLICLALSMLLMMSLLPATVFAEDVIYYVWVNGEQFTAEHRTITCGDGTATYDPATKTVTLENASITENSTLNLGADSKSVCICSIDIDTLTVECKGTNSITASGESKCGILAYGGNLRLWGDGYITVTGVEEAISATNNINIYDVSVIATGTTSAFSKRPYTNGYVIKAGENRNSAVTALETEIAGEKYVWLAPGYGVRVNGGEFAPNNLSIQCGEGTATYDLASNKITLTNATITEVSGANGASGVWCGIFSDRIEDLTIELIGDNTINIPASSYPQDRIYGIITLMSNIELTGAGNLNITITRDNSMAINAPKQLAVNCHGLTATANGLNSKALSFSSIVVPENAIIIKGQDEETAEQADSITSGADSYFLISNHSFVLDSEDDADCTTDGVKHYKCSHCNETKDEAGDSATGHTPSDWIIDKDATETEKGSKHKECTVCHETLETDEIPMLEKKKEEPKEPKQPELPDTGATATASAITLLLAASALVITKKRHK